MRIAKFFLLASTGMSAPAAAEGQTLDEVTVHGSRYTSEVSISGKTPIDRREIPASLSVITSQRLEDQNLTTLAEALGQVTGVTVVPNDGLQSQYRARGYSLGIMNDGVPAFMASSGFLQLDAALYERIEVLRGPNGLMAGSGDPAGSINLVSKRGLEKFGLGVSAGIAHWNGKRATVDVTGPLALNGALRGRVVGVVEDRDHFTDLATSDRRAGYARLDWSITSTTNVSASIAAQSDHAKANYSGLPAFTDGEFLRVPRSTSVAAPWSRTDWDTIDVATALTQQLGTHWSVTVRGWHRDQTQHFHDAFPSEGVRVSDMTLPFARREYDVENERTGVDLYALGEVQLLGRKHLLTVGYNYDRFDQSILNVERTSAATTIRLPFDQRDLLPPLNLPYEQGSETERRQTGLYVQARASLTDKLTLVLGARNSDFDSRMRAIAPSSPTEWRNGEKQRNEVTPAAGVVYDALTWLSLYASYADTFQPQSTQLRADGDPLDPRIGRQHEVGMKGEWFTGALQASVSLFELRDEGRSLSDPENPGFFLNAGEVRSKGWETELVGSPRAGYEIQMGYSRLDAKVVAGTPAQLGQRFSVQEPGHLWKLWVIRRLHPAADSGWTFGVGANAQSSIRVAPPRVQGSYAVVNGMVAYRFNKNFSVGLTGSNLLDEKYYARIGGTNSNNTYGEPRSYSLTLRASY